MASVRQIARRIRSVESTAKITKAMSMIAASKLRRSQDAATMGRDYSNSMSQMVSNVVSQISDDDSNQPLIENRENKFACLVIITPDRGLTGGLIANILKSASSFLAQQTVPVKVVGIGKKGITFAKRMDLEVIGEFIGIGDSPNSSNTLPIADLLIDKFSSGEVDSVHICYANFINTTLQKPTLDQLIPVAVDDLNGKKSEYIYEPNPNQVLNELLPRYIQTLVHHAILEANASEQSARMVAMNQATDNANEMVGDLTLVMNKLRQETITGELLDIVGGVSAIEA
tara:strand:+ start:3602 stop:4459 length:858 start_codon:yes stop_codon:yes gene_type:complete